MAPGRKADPGPKLDWRRLARGGRAVWTDGEGEPGWAAFRAAAAAAGYAAPADDWEAVLAAVRLRFRPWAGGAEPGAADVGPLRTLA
jgi:N-acetylmuramoyl-L-alanine amidase